MKRGNEVRGGVRRAQSHRSGHDAPLEGQGELLAPQEVLSAHAKPKEPKRKGMGEEARFHTGAVVVPPAGWKKLKSAWQILRYLLEEKREAVEKAGLGKLISEAEDNLREAVEVDARPLGKGTSWEEEGEREEDKAAEERARAWKVRGELVAALQRVGFAISETTEEGEVWSDGAAVVKVEQKYASWSSGPKERFTVLAFGDALHRAESLLEEKEQKAKEVPTKGSKGRRKPATAPRAKKGEASPEVPSEDKGQRKEAAGERAALAREHEEKPAPVATPGPWGVVEGEDDGRSKRRSLRVVADDDVVVATLTYDREDTEAEETARQDANLLAAAPDMLELLRKQHALLADLLRSNIPMMRVERETLERLVPQGKQVLAKAEGRAHG